MSCVAGWRGTTRAWCVDIVLPLYYFGEKLAFGTLRHYLPLSRSHNSHAFITPFSKRIMVS
jgi:hypothetical protein